MTEAQKVIKQRSGVPRISHNYAGITLVELVLVTGFVLLIAALAVPGLRGHLESQRIVDATLAIEQIDAAVVAYRERHHRLPASLSDLEIVVPLDPWGEPYRYQMLLGEVKASPRTDSRQVQINTDFDLYSLGPDGASTATVMASLSRDDVIRAHDGRYIGPASQH